MLKKGKFSAGPNSEGIAGQGEFLLQSRMSDGD